MMNGSLTPSWPKPLIQRSAPLFQTHHSRDGGGRSRGSRRSPREPRVAGEGRHSRNVSASTNGRARRGGGRGRWRSQRPGPSRRRTPLERLARDPIGSQLICRSRMGAVPSKTTRSKPVVACPSVPDAAWKSQQQRLGETGHEPPFQQRKQAVRGLVRGGSHPVRRRRSGPRGERHTRLRFARRRPSVQPAASVFHGRTELPRPGDPARLQ